MSKNSREYWATNSPDYWAKRALEREQESYLRGSQRTAKMFKDYQQGASAIRREINDFYTRYAGKYGLTYEQAVRLLNRQELQEWKTSLGEYVTRIASAPDPQLKVLLTAQLDALSYNSSITRLEALNGQISMILNELHEKAHNQLRKEFGIEVVDSYYKKLYDLQARSGFIEEIAKITPHMVEDIVSYPWSGAMFSDRLWRNKEDLVFHLRETVTQGVIQGRSLPVMSREIADRMGQSFKNAERLIRTETNHFHNAASIAAYKAAGVEDYEFMATLDNRTSAICSSLDGKHFKVEDARVGTDFPPMHPNCRSTTVEYDPEDALDWAESGQAMPKNTTFSEWKNAQDNGILSEQHLGDIPITDQAVKNVQLIDVPGFDSSTNHKLMKEHKSLLREAQSLPTGHEVGRVFSLDMKEIQTVPGTIGSVTIPDYASPYIAMHNHPDGGSFSLGDIRQFIARDQLKALTAVGNDGDVYILAKTAGFDSSRMLLAYKSLRSTLKPLEADGNLLHYAKEIENFLKEVEKYGAGYYTGGA